MKDELGGAGACCSQEQLQAPSSTHCLSLPKRVFSSPSAPSMCLRVHRERHERRTWRGNTCCTFGACCSQEQLQAPLCTRCVFAPQRVFSLLSALSMCLRR